MGNGDNARCVFPLTTLQIGDLQSYLSRLSIFLAPESKKFYILVDNQPWLEDLVSRPAHLWQLMVTKSRLSPFANTRGRKVKKETGEFLQVGTSSKTNPSKPKKFERWFSLIDAATLSHKRVLLPVKKLRNSLISNSKLHRTLYGFIIFEVSWSDVRGMNYLNELQSDTSLAIEAKFMKRWEFDSIGQAAKCICSWFPGTFQEQINLKEYLDSATGEVFYDARDKFSTTGDIHGNESAFTDNMSPEEESPCYYSTNFTVYPASVVNVEGIPHTPPPPDCPNKRRKVTMSLSATVEVDMYSEEVYNDSIRLPSSSGTFYASDQERVEATQYRDVLLLVRFNDPELPFKLKDIIVSDLHLLTLLESGLPSWVIFVQSYPGLYHLYRPWMCPLARALYVIISFITVLIGFFDLYKNVPLLKATASRLFGPLFDWIETWEMITRIKYLGTMLFLHNFQKAVKWFLMTTRTIRSFLSIVTQPMAEPFAEFLELLLPFWNMCSELAESLFSVVWIIIGSCYSLVENLIEILLSPLLYIVSAIWSIVMSIFYPVFCILWEILYAPVRLVLGLFSLVAFTCSCISDLLRDVWFFLSGIFQFTADAGPTMHTYEVSMWRSLWDDLFSQVFRAVRSILNGFVAFFTTCNRHRLSIYNHVKELIQRLYRPAKRAQLVNLSHKRKTSGTQNLSEHLEGSRHPITSRKQR